MAEFKNHKYVNKEHTYIDMELDHPMHGWIPITITATDYPKLWKEVVAQNPAPYTEPKEETNV